MWAWLSLKLCLLLVILPPCSGENLLNMSNNEDTVTCSDRSVEEKIQLEKEDKQTNEEQCTLADTSKGKTLPSEKDPRASPAAQSSKSGKKSKKAEEAEILSFPTTLEGFGYTFKNEELRNIKTNERFVFEVRKGDKDYNQKHYEALGEVITDEVYKLLESEVGLKKILIPEDRKPNDPSSFIFASEDALSNPDKLMILIHGSGVVRAGQWARRLIINDNLSSGTQLPFIKQAIAEGYGVLVTNTNRNEEVIEGKKMKIKGSKTPEEHAQYVWKHFVLKAEAKHIDIVAHSYGGVVAVELMKAYFEDFQKRVHKIAFTDSVHDLDLHNVQGSTRKWIVHHAINWVTSQKPLDTPIDSARRIVPKRSAGTLKHEETSYKSFESIFKYFLAPDKQR